MLHKFTIRKKEYHVKIDSLGLANYKRAEGKKWITMDIMPNELKTKEKIEFHIKEHTFFADKVLKLEGK